MSINIRPHGPHECYCVNCGYTEVVTTGMKCNSLICPVCNTRLRSSETGEYRDEGDEGGITRCGGGPGRRDG